MPDNEQQLIILILLTGTLLIISVAVKLLFERISLPPVIGFLLLGFALRVSDAAWHFMTPIEKEVLDFLAQIGIITLLFKVGLESNFKGLIRQLKTASFIWGADVLLSGFIGFATAFYILDLNMIPSLVVGTALTATSVGVSVTVWQEYKATSSENGELLLDVAELDDISAVVLMALLFSLLPLLHTGQAENFLSRILSIGLLFTVKLTGFALLCYLFASFAEHPVVHFFRRLDPPPIAILTVVGIGLVIAGLAGLLGFSAAIGAFFAGLVFSRDPEAVKMETSFLPLYQFFTPFFFFGIGLDISPDILSGAFALGVVLFLAAVLSKMLANGLPVWLMRDLPSGLLIGFSMAPRAEISMIIMQRGLELGDWAVSTQIFGAMAVVTILTCILSPFAVKKMLQKWPQI
ncbi:MAG: cation:proton antiporter [Desulfobulbaceae bacterium]|nr:cation:proton antiporter [Desulfobulbaceae bacterium]